MKKIALSILVALGSIFAAGNAQAQMAVNFTTDPINPEFEALAKQVVEKQTSDPDGANKIFAKLMKKIQKNKEQATAVGKFFLDNNIYPCAKQCAAAAYKCDFSYEPGLLLGVGVHLLRKDYGQAGTKLDEILAANPDNMEALRLSARVYKWVNPYASKSILEQIIEKEPENIDAQKQMGDIAFEYLKDNKLALSSYKKYFDANKNLTKEDLWSGENYLKALDTKHDYFTLIDFIPALEALVENNGDAIVSRYKFYAQVENADYQGAAETIKFITDKRFHDTIYVDRDYAYAAEFYKLGMNDLQSSIAMQKKRLELPDAPLASTIPAAREVAKLYEELKLNDEALEWYDKYFELAGEKALAEDHFAYGVLCSGMKDACATNEEKLAMMQKADPHFEAYMNAYPEKYNGPFRRAILWSYEMTSPDKESIEWYDKTIACIDALPAEEQEAAKTIKLTSLQLVALYYFNVKDKAAAKRYAAQIVKIDPANKVGVNIQKWANQ